MPLDSALLSTSPPDFLTALLTPSQTTTDALLALLRPLTSLIPDSLTLRALPAHWGAVGASFAVCSALYWGVGPWVSRQERFLGRWNVKKVYERLEKRQKVDWMTRFPSQVFCVFIVPYVIPLFWDTQLQTDGLYGYSPRAGTACALAVGYFLWDTIVTIPNYATFGPGFLAHATLCLVIFSVGLGPFLLPFVPWVLIWESSTIFLNFNYVLDKFGYSGSTLQKVNAAILLPTFFFARVVAGTYITTRLDKLLYTRYAELPPALTATIVISNKVLMLLQYFWLYKMTSSIARRFNVKDDKAIEGGRGTGRKGVANGNANGGAVSKEE